MERRVAAAAAGNPNNKPTSASVMANGGSGLASPVSFDTPRMPVIFVLGGPGSGKITHSETLTRHRKGYVHVNMTEKMHQILEGTGKKRVAASRPRLTNVRACSRSYPTTIIYRPERHLRHPHQAGPAHPHVLPEAGKERLRLRCLRLPEAPQGRRRLFGKGQIKPQSQDMQQLLVKSPDMRFTDRSHRRRHPPELDAGEPRAPDRVRRQARRHRPRDGQDRAQEL